MRRYASSLLILLSSVAYAPVVVLAVDYGPSSADLWNILQCMPWPWMPHGTNPAEEIFLKGLTQPDFREWTVRGGGWDFEDLKRASEESAMSCKVGPDGIERDNPNAGADPDNNQLQHSSQYKIDTSSAEWAKYLQDLANIAYSIACFHGPYKHNPGFSQDCKKQVSRFYSKTPVRLKRGQIERLHSKICQRRQVLDSSRTKRPAQMNTKEGRDFWRFINARHCAAERALTNWMQDEWIPVEGDEQKRNARWYHNRRYESTTQQPDKKGGVWGFMQELWDGFTGSPYAPWNRGGAKHTPARQGVTRSAPRIPLRKGF